MLCNHHSLSVTGHSKMATRWLALVILVVGLQESHGGTVNTTSLQAVEGNSIAIKCYFTLAEDEVLEYLYIDTYVPNRGFVDVVKFWANGTNEYLTYAESMVDRTTLIANDDYVALRFDEVKCTDFGEYYCNLQTNDTYSYKWMRLDVRGPSAKPSIMMTKQSGCYDDGEDLEAVCVGLVGGATARFQWRGYRADNTTLDLTHLADPGPPYRPSVSCSFKRASHIKFNISTVDDGLVLRCDINDEVTGISPSTDDECGEHCAEADPIHLIRHPQKPIVMTFRTTYCHGNKLQAACYGEIGGPSGHYHWYKFKDGQTPIEITTGIDPGSPYRLHGSCQYERASMISLAVTAGDNGIVLRCMLDNHDTGINASTTAECEDHCADTRKITVQATCGSATPPKKPTRTSGATTLLTGISMIFTAVLLYWTI